ncbi:C-C chemokine receptor type 5-like [Silurus meridionalis]|nr:C-C chemokine receptor type 5-like [Silurus meridionalis]
MEYSNNTTSLSNMPNSNSTTDDYASYYSLEEDNDKQQCNSSIKNFSRVFLPTLYSIVFIVGFIGNALVLCVLVKYHKSLMTMKSQKKHKAVRLILVLVIVFFLFWTPYNIVLFMKVLHHLGYMQSCRWEQDLSMATQWVETIAFSHCCLNPIIYAFVGQKFRNLVLKILKEWFPLCFGRCTTIVSDFSERRSSMFSRSSEISTTKIV